MDWKTFISEIAKALAWPALIFTAFILFKKQLSIILHELAKYPYFRWKHGENELEIGVNSAPFPVKLTTDFLKYNVYYIDFIMNIGVLTVLLLNHSNWYTSKL